jgi:hypothetical protein
LVEHQLPNLPKQSAVCAPVREIVEESGVARLDESREYGVYGRFRSRPVDDR